MLLNNLATRTFASLIVAMVLGVGCTADTSYLSTRTVEEAASRLDRGDGQFVDANSSATRAKYGAIDGAILLSSYRDYALAELPSDQSRAVVFYCYSPRCGAAADAARRAVAAGFDRVFVMPAGISGWRDAQQAIVAVVSE